MDDHAHFLEQNYKRLLEYAAYKTFGDRDLAQDILHELIARVLEGRLTVDLERAPLTVLQLALYNCLRDHNREARKQGLCMLEDENDEMVLETPWSHPTPWRPEVDDWIADLNSRQQDLVRSILGGMSILEKAREWGIAEQSCREQWNRVIKILQKRAKSG